jgi:hypothetical protein
MEFMDNKVKEICNNNLKNIPSQTLYDSFNEFIFDKDIKVIGKLLQSNHFIFFNTISIV